jgi:hypothetical protein
VGLPAIANVTLETLLEERRKEFLGEGLRWNDLVRSGLAVTKMNAWLKMMQSRPSTPLLQTI